MKKSILILSIFFNQTVTAQATRDSNFVGVYLKALYDLSPSDFSFGADFYMWNISADSLSLFRKIEIINAKQIDDYSAFIEKDSNSFISYENCKARLVHNWNLKNYPFDKQKFQIKIEAQESVNYMQLGEDRNGFLVANDMKIPGWKISKFYIEKTFKLYPSDFGFHNIKFSNKRFDGISFIIELSRNSWGLYFKLFSGLYIAFFVSFLAFFVKAKYVDPRFGLSIGGLFASVANKYVVDANIPATIGFSFVDMVHFLSFIFIFATLVISAISLRFFSQGRIEKSKSLDKKAARIVFFLYIILNGGIVFFAS